MGLWTELHALTILPAFVVYIVIALIIARLVRGKSERVKYIPLQIITVMLLILEIIKQIVSVENGVYNLYSLPFHYCSLFLYLLPFHSFYKGNHRKIVNSAAFGCLASLFFFMLVMPAVVYSDGAISGLADNFMSFHTVVFHNLVCLYFLLVVAMKLYEFNRSLDLKVMAVFLAIYVVIATVLSHTLEVNFHNLYRCNLAIVEDIRLQIIEAIGWAGQVIYVVVMFILTILFAYAAYFLTQLVLSLISRTARKIKTRT